MSDVNATIDPVVSVETQDRARLLGVPDARKEIRGADAPRHRHVVDRDRLRIDELLDRVEGLARPCARQERAAQNLTGRHRPWINRERRRVQSEVADRVVDAR
jgi:hypothetical protein